MKKIIALLFSIMTINTVFCNESEELRKTKRNLIEKVEEDPKQAIGDLLDFFATQPEDFALAVAKRMYDQNPKKAEKIVEALYAEHSELFDTYKNNPKVFLAIYFTVGVAVGKSLKMFSKSTGSN